MTKDKQPVQIMAKVVLAKGTEGEGTEQTLMLTQDGDTTLGNGEKGGAAGGADGAGGGGADGGGGAGGEGGGADGGAGGAGGGNTQQITPTRPRRTPRLRLETLLPVLPTWRRKLELLTRQLPITGISTMRLGQTALDLNVQQSRGSSTM